MKLVDISTKFGTDNLYPELHTDLILIFMGPIYKHPLYTKLKSKI
jgi:hypothetical protein